MIAFWLLLILINMMIFLYYLLFFLRYIKLTQWKWEITIPFVVTIYTVKIHWRGNAIVYNKTGWIWFYFIINTFNEIRENSLDVLQTDIIISTLVNFPLKTLHNWIMLTLHNLACHEVSLQVFLQHITSTRAFVLIFLSEEIFGMRGNGSEISVGLLIWWVLTATYQMRLTHYILLCSWLVMTSVEETCQIAPIFISIHLFNFVILLLNLAHV